MNVGSLKKELAPCLNVTLLWNIFRGQFSFHYLRVWCKRLLTANSLDKCGFFFFFGKLPESWIHFLYCCVFRRLKWIRHSFSLMIWRSLDEMLCFVKIWNSYQLTWRNESNNNSFMSANGPDIFMAHAIFVRHIEDFFFTLYFGNR